MALQGVLRFVGEGESRATHLAERLGRQRPRPQPAHRRTGGAGLRGPPAGSGGRPGPAGRAVPAGRGEAPRHRGAPHGHPAGLLRDWSEEDAEETAETLRKLAESLRTSARATTAGSTTTTTTAAGVRTWQATPPPPGRHRPPPRRLRSPPAAGCHDPPPDHGSPDRAAGRVLHRDPQQHHRCERAADHHVRAQGHPDGLRLGHHRGAAGQRRHHARSGASSPTSSTRSSWSSSAS